MASSQEPWVRPALSTFSPRSSPMLYPSFTNAALSDDVLLDPAMPSSQLDFSDDSAWLPQHVDPSQLSRDPNTQDFAGPDWDTQFLTPNTPSLWHGQQHNVPTPQAAPSTIQSQRVGVAPLAREQLRQVEVPSLDDQDRTQKLDEELAKVRLWLQDSQLSSSHLAPHVSSDRRARAHSSPAPQPALDGPSPHAARSLDELLPLQTDFLNVPGPGAMLQVTEDEEDEDSFGFCDGQLPPEESTTPPAFPEPLHMDTSITATDDVTASRQGAERYESLEPWTDDPDQIDSAHVKEQPQSSNAAMVVFMRKARDLETASLTATLGSRRRSEADLKSLASQQGANAGGPAEAPQSSLFRRYFAIRRYSNNARKRKEDDDQALGPMASPAPIRKESQGGFSPLKRVISRPRSPRLDVGAEHQLHSNPTIGDRARKTLSRMRSKSDLSNAANPSALAEQWARQGGPPVPSLRSQEAEAAQARESERIVPRDPQLFSPEEADGDDDAFQDASPSMPLHVGEAPAAADKDAFRAHISKLNPRIEPYMLSRLTVEQDKRFRRLVDYRAKHELAVKSAWCQTGDFCNDLGKGAKYPSTPPARGADSGAPLFWIETPEASQEGAEQGEKAHFPDGIPLPPVSRLPAEFECPVCFQVKKILKPSDWTKHVNEDIQPFTCTFPDCSEAKSFKRKADWVRHESEKHRHLEAWQCDLEGCQHRCYRRDNFVQHLVREHRLPEPLRGNKAANNRATSAGDLVPYHVERCRVESTKQASEEPCRFCGNHCSNWKKLSVHLAQHMQQISIPTLKLVGIEIPPADRGQAGSTSSNNDPHRHPQTPLDTSRGSRTPSLSHPGSSNRSDPQSSISSGEGWDALTTPLVSVTDTSKPTSAAAAPMARHGPHARAPSLGGWTPRSQPSGKQMSTYPVKGFPELGLSWNDSSKQPKFQAQADFFGNLPQTPVTPAQPELRAGFAGTPQGQPGSFSTGWPTYPPPGRSSTSAQPSQPPVPTAFPSMISEQQMSDSPVETTAPNFPAATSYGLISGADGFPSDITGQGQDEGHYYSMQQGPPYTLSEDSHDYAQSRVTFLPQTSEEDEPQQYHSATYPPQFYHPGR